MTLSDDEVRTVRLPFAVRRRGGGKLVSGAGQSGQANAPGADCSLIAALAKAWAWQRRLESGDAASIDDLASAEHTDVAFASRLLQLAALCPKVLEALLDGGLPFGTPLRRLLACAGLTWANQLELNDSAGTRRPDRWGMDRS